MEQDFDKGTFYRTMMTGVFVGFFATLIILLCVLGFTRYFDYPLSDIINVSSVIFAVNLIFLLVGLLYYGFTKSSRKGEIAYSIFFLLLTAFLVWKVSGVHRTGDQLVNHEFKELLSGIIIILGVLAAVAIPLLYHSKKFEEHVL